MSDPLVEEALRRRELFDNLTAYLERFKMIVLKVDPNAEMNVFGSVAEGTHNYSSDVDILVITEEDRVKMLEAVAREEFIRDTCSKTEEIEWYRRMAKLVKV